MTQALPPATIVMNFHNEEVYAHKSLLGFLRIREYSAKQGNRVDLICVLDNPTALTEKIVHQFVREHGSHHDQIIKTNFKNLSAARNTAIDICKTEYLGFNDGDDFFSANRVEEMLSAQLKSPTEILCFTEKVINFGSMLGSSIFRESDTVSMSQMINYHFWTYASFGHISTYQNHYFNEMVGSKDSRFVYEDWDFNLRCVAHGIILKPIQGTYMFYRRKEFSMLVEHNSLNSFVPPSYFFNQI